ncbi:DgyrCDS10608 [Dimorphilus gyrociliatus]|uniref:DgyrCDS10608 n=1 Tax=Dimorphilus gyrociliatus TaxID=2664684 RepID=A0A7I8W0Q8_9ANNE|nr:DgyrCDS10608 [Dimorphilus gyrociliatus]
MISIGEVNKRSAKNNIVLKLPERLTNPSNRERLKKELLRCLYYRSWGYISEPQIPMYTGVFSLAFSRKGNPLLIGFDQGEIRGFDVTSNKQIWDNVDMHNCGVNCLEFINDYQFVSGSDDTVVKLWDLRKLDYSIQNLYDMDEWVQDVSFSFGQKLLITNGIGSGFFVYQLVDGRFELVAVCKNDKPIYRAKLIDSNDGMMVYSNWGDSKAYIVHNFYRLIRERSNHTPPSELHLKEEISCKLEGLADCIISSIAVHPFERRFAMRGTTAGRKKRHMKSYTFIFDANRVSESCEPTCTHQESSKTRNFTKEMSFSFDGYALSSPNRSSVRLLGLINNPMSKNRLQVLNEVKGSNSADSAIVTRFSPVEPLLAVGWLSGSIKLFKPS